jgi:hypothetical protein
VRAMARLHSIVVVAALVATQGCAVVSIAEPRLADACLFDEEDFGICVAVLPEDDSFDVPLLWHWQGRGAPFDLQVRFNDYRQSFESVSIERVRIEYEDGESFELDEPQSSKFEMNQALGWGQAGIKFPDAVRRQRGGSIVVTGELRRSDGTVRPFQTRSNLTIESDSQSSPYYTWLIYGIT